MVCGSEGVFPGKRVWLTQRYRCHLGPTLTPRGARSQTLPIRYRTLGSEPDRCGGTRDAGPGVETLSTFVESGSGDSQGGSGGARR